RPRDQPYEGPQFNPSPVPVGQSEVVVSGKALHWQLTLSPLHWSFFVAAPTRPNRYPTDVLVIYAREESRSDQQQLGRGEWASPLPSGHPTPSWLPQPSRTLGTGVIAAVAGIIDHTAQLGRRSIAYIPHRIGRVSGTAALLIGSSEQGRRHASAHFLFECGGRGGGI